MNEFGTTLRSTLWAYKIKQKDLARDLGWTDSYLSQIVRGHKTVSPEHVAEIATALVLSPDQLEKLHRAAARDRGYEIA